MLGGLSKGRRGGRPRARTLRASVPTSAGTVWHVPTLGLLAPVTWAKTGGNANLTLTTATGAIAAATALAAAESQEIAGTATGADGVVIPWAATLIGAVARPAAPTIELEPGNGQIVVTVTDGDDGGAAITHHRLYAGTESGDLTRLATLPAAATHVIDDLANGTPLFVQASALNSAGEGPRSAEASATPLAPILLGAPTLIPATIAEGAEPGTLVGALGNIHPDATVALSDDAGGRFALTGEGDIVAGLTATDYETATDHAYQIAITQTLAAAANSPRTDVLSIAVTEVDDPIVEVPDPVITYDAETNIFANANGDAGQWHADDEAIDGAAGATWAGYSEEGYAGRAISQIIGEVRSNVIIQQTAGAPYHIDTFSYASGQKITDHGWTGLPSTGATTELNKFTVNASGQLQCGSQALIGDINAVVTQDAENAAHFIEVDAQYTFYNLLCVKDERNYIAMFRGNDMQVNVYKVIDGVQTDLLGTGNSYVRLAAGSFVDGARTRGEILTNGQFRFLYKAPGSDQFLPYSFNPTSQTDASYPVDAALAGATMVGLKGRGFNTQTDNFAWGSLERPISINSAVAVDDEAGRVIRVAGKATSDFTDAFALIVDAATGELLSDWTAVDGAGTDFTIDIPTPANAYDKAVTIWLRDAVYREYATYSTLSVPLYEPFYALAEQRPGINWNFINAWGSADIANNRLLQSRWLWNDGTAIDLVYCDDEGIPTGDLAPGKTGWRVIFFENCPIARGGTWELNAPGASMTPSYGSGVTGISNVPGKLTFSVTAGETVGVTSALFTSAPSGGFASITIKPVGAGSEVANPAVVADYGREASGIKLVRVMRASNGEHPIRTRSSDGASVPEFPIGNGAAVASILEEYDADTFWPFAVNQSDADVLKIATDWNSVAGADRMFFVQNGNESFWNGSSYAAQDLELTRQAVLRGYTAATDPNTMIVGAAGVWTNSETGATLQVIPAGTEIITASNYHRTMVRALRDVPIGEIVKDNATLGSSDTNFLYMANWADLWKAGYRAKGVRTIEMANIVKSVVGADRVRSLVDFQLGATPLQIFNWLDQLDDGGVPIWQQIDHYSTSGYVTLNLGPKLAETQTWINYVMTDQTEFLDRFFEYVPDQVDKTLDDLRGYRRTMPGLFKNAYPAADAASFPTLIIYEHGMHWRIDGYEAYAAKTNAALRAGNQDGRWYVQYRRLEDGVSSLGLATAVAFVDYERPGNNQAFGRLWMPGDYTNKQPYLALRDALGKPVVLP